MIFRLPKDSDALELANLYEYYVLNSTATFEITPPDEHEMKNRTSTEIYPCLVCEIDGKAVGYAYASAHNIREAYKHNAVLTAYIHKDYTGRKIGVMFLLKLMEILKNQGVCNVYSSVTSDNIASVKMHNKLEFETCAEYKKTGKKFGKWIDVTWFCKRVLDDAEDFIPFSKLDPKILEEIL